MTRPIIRVVSLALVSIIGIGGMLLSDDGWDWLFLAIATLPLQIGGAVEAARRMGSD